MTFSQKKLPKSQIAIEVQLESEELDKQKPKAIEVLTKDLRLEGFRPGHVPLSIAEKHLGEAAVLSEAARAAIQEAYLRIVQQENLDVIGEPEVQVLKLAPGNPLEFRVTVAVLSEVELPDYKKIAGLSTRKKVSVEKEEVNAALHWLKESRKTKDGVTPEMDSQFVQGAGDFSDVASLRASIEEGLRHEKEIQEKDRLREEIIEEIAKQSNLEVPDVLVEREKQVLLSQLKLSVADMLKMSFEEYLQKAKKTEQEVIDSFALEAEQRVKRFLVVREVAKKEEIKPAQEEIEQETNNIIKHSKKDLDLKRLREYTEGVLRHEKTLQFLEQFAPSLSQDVEAK